MDSERVKSGGVITVPGIPTMAEAYGWCGITPIQYMEFTPAELDMMIQVSRIKAGISDTPKQGQKEQQDDDTMEKIVSGFLHPVINACQGGL